jgi:enoyl-CoA hydratase/carnithine racemase
MGLVSRVVPAAAVVSEALGLAATIAAQAPLAVQAAKEAVRLAEELPLSAGLRHERRAFYALFATEDQTEGMTAFVEKRRPEWKGR